MRFLILAGLAVCLLVPIGVVALRSGDESLTRGLEAAGCRGIDHRYETRQRERLLVIAMDSCVVAGRELNRDERVSVAGAVALATPEQCLDSLVIWPGDTASVVRARLPAIVEPADHATGSRRSPSCDQAAAGEDDGSSLAFAALIPLCIALATCFAITVASIRRRPSVLVWTWRLGP